MYGQELGVDETVGVFVGVGFGVGVGVGVKTQLLQSLYDGTPNEGPPGPENSTNE